LKRSSVVGTPPLNKRISTYTPPTSSTSSLSSSPIRPSGVPLDEHEPTQADEISDLGLNPQDIQMLELENEALINQLENQMDQVR